MKLKIEVFLVSSQLQQNYNYLFIAKKTSRGQLSLLLQYTSNCELNFHMMIINGSLLYAPESTQALRLLNFGIFLWAIDNFNEKYKNNLMEHYHDLWHAVRYFHQQYNRKKLFLSLIEIYQLISTLGLSKQDLWGLGAESQCIVTSCPFAKMIPQWQNHFGKRKDPVLPTLEYIVKQ